MKATRSVIQWLLDSDSSIRWQAMRDLTDTSDEEVPAERARVATEGAGARLLALQGADGRWGGRGPWNRGWNSTMHVLMLLRDMGLGSRERPGTPRVEPRSRPRHLARLWAAGMRRQSFLCRRGGAVHQWAGSGDRRLLRPGLPGHRRGAARRAAARRRLELRGCQRLDAVVI